MAGRRPEHAAQTTDDARVDDSALTDRQRAGRIGPRLAAAVSARCYQDVVSSAPIAVKINQFGPVAAGVITCVTEIVSGGRTIANLQSRVVAGDKLIARANSNYSSFSPGTQARQ